MERRRNNEFVTHAEMRRAVQPLYDLKGRVEAPLRFYEAMRMLNLETLLPELLKDEQAKQILKEVHNTNWESVQRWALLIGAIASIAMIGQIVLDIAILIK
jgi:hypothetical protein